MGMNPDTNRFEALNKSLSIPASASAQEQMGAIKAELIAASRGQLLRPNGEPVPTHWSVFRVGEDVVIKDYTFRVAYIGESNILFEPVGPVVVGKDE